MKKFPKSVGILVLALIACSPCISRAATIIDPFSATGTSGAAGFGSPDDVINGNGLSGVGPILSQLHNEDPAPGDAPAGYTTGEWLVSGTTATINFDLGAVYTLTDIYVWNYAEATAYGANLLDRSAQNVDVLASVTGPPAFQQSLTLSEAVMSGTPTVYGNANPPAWWVSYEVPVVDYTFSSPITARYITLDVLNNYNAGDPYVGLGAVRFGGALPAPEPTSCVLFGIGAAGLLLAARRRRSAR